MRSVFIQSFILALYQNSDFSQQKKEKLDFNFSLIIFNFTDKRVNY